MKNQMQSPPKTYRYALVVIGLCLVNIIIYFNSTAMALYYASICSEFGFDRSALQLYFTLLTMVSTFAAPFIMKLVYPKVGARNMILFMGGLGGLVYMAFSLGTQLWHWYALAVLSALLTGSLPGAVTMVIINQWFIEKKGFVTGLTTTMGSAFGVIMAGILGSLISQNWRYGYQLSGAIILIFCVIAGLFFVRSSPKTCGMTPYGYDKLAGQQGGDAKKAMMLRGVTTKIALSTAPFWLLVAGFMLLGFTLAFSQSFVYYFMEVGFDLGTASAFLGMLSGSMILWKFGLGWLSDKLGCRLTYTLTLLVTIAGFVLQSISGGANQTVPYIFVFCFAATTSAMTTLNPIMIREIFGMRDYSGIFPLTGIPLGISTAVCVVIWGVVYNATGSYAAGHYLAILGAAALLVAIQLSYKAAAKESFQSKMEEVEA
ncbi:MAG: MFS transporter [Clostridiaceae bacterium]|nr:MFS transporter [Eubacteriales bacterium]